MCVRGGIFLTLTGCFVYAISLALASKGAEESVDYWPMCFELDAPVLLETSKCRECEFTSPNLPSGWSINFNTGAITGPAQAGDQGAIQVYVTTKAGVVNSTAVYEVVSFALMMGFTVDLVEVYKRIAFSTMALIVFAYY
jgi:hypothetical protein